MNDSKSVWVPPTLDVWLNETVDSRRWLIKDFVLADGLVLVSGQQKRAMKTFSALTMMVALGTGKSVSMFQPAEAMPVLFIEEEGGRSETRERILGIAKTKQWGGDKDPIAQDKLNNIYFAHRNRVKLDNSNWKKSLVEFVSDKGIQCVFFDAMTYMHHADENKTHEMLNVIETLQMLREKGATCVFLSHLSGSRGEDKKADIDSQVRGATVLCNAYDLHLAYRRYQMRDAHIDLTIRGRSSEEKYCSCAFDIRSHDEERNGETVNVIDSAALSMVTKVLGSIDELVTKCEDKLLPGVEYTGKELRELWKLGAKNMKDVLEALIDEQRVVRSGDRFTLSEQGEEQ